MGAFQKFRCEWLQTFFSLCLFQVVAFFCGFFFCSVWNQTTQTFIDSLRSPRALSFKWQLPIVFFVLLLKKCFYLNFFITISVDFFLVLYFSFLNLNYCFDWLFTFGQDSDSVRLADTRLDDGLLGILGKPAWFVDIADGF